MAGDEPAGTVGPERLTRTLLLLTFAPADAASADDLGQRAAAFLAIAAGAATDALLLQASVGLALLAAALLAAGAVANLSAAAEPRPT